MNSCNMQTQCLVQSKSYINVDRDHFLVLPIIFPPLQPCYMPFEVREDLTRFHFWVTGRDTRCQDTCWRIMQVGKARLSGHPQSWPEASIQYEGGAPLLTLSPHPYIQRGRVRVDWVLFLGRMWSPFKFFPSL